MPTLQANTGRRIKERNDHRGLPARSHPNIRRARIRVNSWFLVTNHSAKRMWFEVGTRGTSLRRTPLVRPGGTDRFYYVFRVRGTVPFRYGGPGMTTRTGVFKVV